MYPENYARCVSSILLLLCSKRRMGKVRSSSSWLRRCNSRLCKQDMTCLHYPVRKSRFGDCQSPSPSSLGSSWAECSFILSVALFLACLSRATCFPGMQTKRVLRTSFSVLRNTTTGIYSRVTIIFLPAHFYNTATSRYNAATREMLTRSVARKSTISPSNTSTPTAPTRGYSSQVQNTESTPPADKYAY